MKTVFVNLYTRILQIPLQLSKFYSKFYSKMAHYIRNPVDIMQYDFDNVSQVSQIVYHNERIIIIDYDNTTNSILIEDNGEWFYLSSPDIPALTINHVLDGLGYGDQQVVVTWRDDPNVDVLNTPVQQTQLNQIALYPPNHPIPMHHNIGPFPEIAGQPIGNQNDDDDDNTTITYPSSESIDSDE